MADDRAAYAEKIVRDAEANRNFVLEVCAFLSRDVEPKMIHIGHYKCDGWMKFEVKSIAECLPIMRAVPANVPMTLASGTFTTLAPRKAMEETANEKYDSFEDIAPFIIKREENDRESVCWYSNVGGYIVKVIVELDFRALPIVKVHVPEPLRDGYGRVIEWRSKQSTVMNPPLNSKAVRRGDVSFEFYFPNEGENLEDVFRNWRG